MYLLGRYECGAYLYNTTRATKVEGADPKKNADKRVFSSRWKNPGDIAFYKDIADSEGWGSNPKHTDRFVEKENVFTLGTVNSVTNSDRTFVPRLGYEIYVSE